MSSATCPLQSYSPTRVSSSPAKTLSMLACPESEGPQAGRPPVALPCIRVVTCVVAEGLLPLPPLLAFIVSISAKPATLGAVWSVLLAAVQYPLSSCIVDWLISMPILSRSKSQDYRMPDGCSTQMEFSKMRAGRYLWPLCQPATSIAGSHICSPRSLHHGGRPAAGLKRTLSYELLV